jgi:hypothetical protein
MHPQNPAPTFNEAKVAYDLVKKTGDDLRSEHEEVCSEIAKVEGEMQSLPIAYLPFDDLKEGVLDIIEESGARYAEGHIRSALSSFVTGGARGAGMTVSDFGKPLHYQDLEKARSGEDTALGLAPLLSTARNHFDDRLLYFMFGEMVKDGLRKVLDRMTPAELGYNTIKAAEIGLPRAERQVAIAALQSRLTALQARKGELEEKLIEIGRPLPRAVKGRP